MKLIQTDLYSKAQSSFTESGGYRRLTEADLQCVCVCVCMQVCIHACVPVYALHMYIYIYSVCLCVCVCACKYVYTHVYLYTLYTSPKQRRVIATFRTQIEDKEGLFVHGVEETLHL